MHNDAICTRRGLPECGIGNRGAKKQNSAAAALTARIGGAYTVNFATENSRQLSKTERNLLTAGVAATIVLLIMIMVLSVGMMHSTARKKAYADLHPYYTSISVEKGDSLWSIASRYSAESPMDVQTYVSEIKRINHLTGDTIHAGDDITIVYYK